MFEGVPLWHERDISHSSVERIALPDAAIGTDYLLHLTSRLVNGLTVDGARMQANLESTGGLIYTSAVLLELVDGGPVARGRVLGHAVGGDAAPGRPARRSARPCARTPPPPDSRSTRPGWTRSAGRSATSSDSDRSSTGLPR